MYRWYNNNGWYSRGFGNARKESKIIKDFLNQPKGILGAIYRWFSLLTQ